LTGIVNLIHRIQPFVKDKDDLFIIHKKYDAMYKGVLNLINYVSGGFLNFENGNPVSIASSLEDHHIFPNDYLRKNWAAVSVAARREPEGVPRYGHRDCHSEA
jgi:hypothetical protein